VCTGGNYLSTPSEWLIMNMALRLFSDRLLHLSIKLLTLSRPDETKKDGTRRRGREKASVQKKKVDFWLVASRVRIRSCIVLRVAKKWNNAQCSVLLTSLRLHLLFYYD